MSSRTVNGVVATAINKNANRRKTVIPTQQDLPPGHIIASIDAPKGCVGRIIGARGRNIYQLKRQFQVGIDIDQQQGAPKVFVYGPDVSVEQATVEIQRTIQHCKDTEEKRKARASPHSLEQNEKAVSTKVRKNILGLVLGEGRKNIQSITDKCRVKYTVQDTRTNGCVEVTLWGEKRSVDDAKNRLDRIIDLAMSMHNSSSKGNGSKSSHVVKHSKSKKVNKQDKQKKKKK
jgi:polyribonucleotide nucleotidyltransferase